MLMSMPSRVTLLVLGLMAAHAAAAARPKIDPETAKRLRVFQEDRTYPLPSTKEVAAAEQVLALQPCIGGLDKWYRRYARKIDWRQGHVDRDLLWFRFREAGLYGYRSGRKIGRLADLVDPDDRQFRYASGTYNLRTQQVTFVACGSNWPERNVIPARER